MRLVKFTDENATVLGTFKSSIAYFKEDKVVIYNKIYVITDTLKYVYEDADEIEYITVAEVGTL